MRALARRKPKPEMREFILDGEQRPGKPLLWGREHRRDPGCFSNNLRRDWSMRPGVNPEGPAKNHREGRQLADFLSPRVLTPENALLWRRAWLDLRGTTRQYTVGNAQNRPAIGCKGIQVWIASARRRLPRAMSLAQRRSTRGFVACFFFRASPLRRLKNEQREDCNHHPSFPDHRWSGQRSVRL